MRKVNARWDSYNRRWECSIGSGKNRRWFRSRIEGDEGRITCEARRDKALNGVKPMRPGTLGEFVESVWWPRVKQKSTKSTLDGYKSALRREVSKFYGLMLDDMRLEVLQPWVSGMPYQPKTVHNVYRVMSSILELARLTGRYLRTDHKLVILPEIGERWAVTGLEPANIAKIIAQAKGSAYEGPIWAASFLGLRRNEVCGLKKGHVRILEESAVITIQHNRQVGIETNKLKSKRKGEARVIEVPRAIGEKLLGFGDAHDGIYVFHGVDGKPIHPNMLTRCMAGICETAKVPAIAFKDLRAACRSNLSAAGVPDLIIMQILGHSNFRTSMLYQDQRGSRQVEAFSALLSNG